MMKYFKSRFNIHPLRDRYDEISDWFTTPLGRRLLVQERKVLAEEMRYLFGYHFMQLSAVKTANFASSSRINHCFSFAPCDVAASQRHDTIQGVTNYDELPIPDDSIDVSVLHHVLEFSDSPHQVLKEAARVTIPKGYIIIVAFNPLSLSGVFHPLGALLNLSGVSRRRSLRSSRLTDWLEFLDFSCTTRRSVFHNLPLNNARYLATTNFFETRLLERLRLSNCSPSGMSYVIVARKDKAGLMPVKPKWERGGLLSGMPIAKPAISATAAKECLVLPFRQKARRDF